MLADMFLGHRRVYSSVQWLSQVILAVLIAGQDECPRRCDCRPPEVYCARAKLVTFPAGLQTGTTFLDVGHNNITAIHDDTFQDLGILELVVLVADNNSITSVGEHAFRGLSDLQFLHLSGNRLTNLHSQVFSHNPKIRHVDLTGNALHMPSDGPLLAANSLEWLDLDYCGLTIIPSSAFAKMPKLRYLNLNNNSLRVINVTALRPLSYLRYLKMLSNPLQCDCSMKPVWTWLFQRKTKVEASCGSQMSWSVMKEVTC
ncbi:leucine-rich repeat transmembrane neuronal protein 4 [Anabrus simplex]|uniref:leucine-rich repeat transmembrane neuronal protein 4 n=1 Tax=Anabrus simplex TaxID=316456 RepID=UPI0035A3A26A